MDSIRIIGGRPLEGRIAIGGAKNAALPLMAAALLTEQTLRLGNLPRLADIATLAELLAQHGVEVGMEGRAVSLRAGRISNTTAPYDIVRKMRASVLVLGPLVARAGGARVSLPGGCAIGTRPVDLHLDGLTRLGARIRLEDGYILAEAPKGLTGARIRFPFVSVGASENLLMAATLAKGETVLENAAREPEVADLADCLVAMGARIEGIGTDTLTIQGVARLGGAEHAVPPDRIETASYAIAAAITGGEVVLEGGRLDHMAAAAGALGEAGVTVEESGDAIRVARTGAPVRGVDLTTRPYPGFPTDVQAQMMALMSTAEGTSQITESIFENRFMHVQELLRMGADIRVTGSSAMVRGVPRLSGAPVMATDLRASVSLVLAGLAAQGETRISRVYHLDRGYERLEQKLAACGAEIERISG
jgi:UDP-N-acetylglucosamine 1-carboxyvinyltransferase